MSKLSLNGYVIHRRPYRETSMLVDFFTQEYGRITTVVKGARTEKKSSRKSMLQPLQLVQFDCVGRSNLKNLTRIEAVDLAIRCEGNALYAAFYMNEILQRALPESEPVEALFAQYQYTLNQLAAMDVIDNLALEPFLRKFEFALLVTLGHLPDLSCESETYLPIDGGFFYHYLPERGLVKCHANEKNAISGQSLLKMLDDNFSAETLAPAKYMCRITLPLAIGTKPIKSRELFV